MIEASAMRSSPVMLLDAVRETDPERAGCLLEAGVDPNRPDPDFGVLPLHAAIDDCEQPDRRYELVDLLLSHGADPCRRGAQNFGPLFLALVREDTRVMELLLRHGADPNAEVGYAGKGLLWWAKADYIHEIYGRELPEQPDPAVWEDTEALILFLEGLARRHGRPGPEALRLLWFHGARY